MMSSFISVLYSALFHMELMTAHIRGVGDCRSTAKLHNPESIVENGFVGVAYSFEESGSGGKSVMFRKSDTDVHEI